MSFNRSCRATTDKLYLPISKQRGTPILILTQCSRMTHHLAKKNHCHDADTWGIIVVPWRRGSFTAPRITGNSEA